MQEYLFCTESRIVLGSQGDAAPRSIRLELLQCENRALLSGTLALGSAHISLVAAADRHSKLKSSAHHVRNLDDAIPPNSLAAFTQPYQRLGLYDPQSNTFVPVTPSDPGLAGKKVVVLVHGFAPGYLDWVKAAKKQGYVLTWWDTFLPERPPSISAAIPPESAWLLKGHTYPAQSSEIINNNLVVESANGMAQDLIKTDGPTTEVLAYTWLDESATSDENYHGIPLHGNISEANTTLNGERLAVALEQVLGPQFSGELQLIGHSHGSKVATVAADALMNSTSDPIHVNQLTILDSPETGALVVGDGLAHYNDANDNWYYLSDLNISDSSTVSATTTFVDNYWSFLGEPYNGIPYPDSNSSLSQIVDVELYPDQYPEFNAGRHTYAAYFYAGSSESSSSVVGMKWSPLSPSAAQYSPGSDLSYQQDWNFAHDFPTAKDQYNLDSTGPTQITPVIHSVALNPVTTVSRSHPLTAAGNRLTRRSLSTLNRASSEFILKNDPTNGASMTLTQNHSKQQSVTTSFTSAETGDAYGLRGLLFDYQFTNFIQGDKLNIYIDGKLGFRMDPYIIEPGNQPSSGQTVMQKGTISVGDLSDLESHTLRFVLTSAQKNSTSSVTVSSLKQYAY